MIKDILSAKLKERLPYTDYDTTEKRYMLDAIDKEIIELLQQHFDLLDGLYILVILSHLGAAPNLVYDDDGMWAITTGGFSSIPNKEMEFYSVDLTFVIEKEEWFSDPKEAIKYTLNNWFN